LAVGGVVPSGSPESLLARIEGVLIPSGVELKAGSKNEITHRHCHVLQVEKVSAQSLPKTGILPVSAGDFRQFLARVVLSRGLETPFRMQESAYFAGFSRRRCKLS
jgi:hypothetical protein